MNAKLSKKETLMNILNHSTNYFCCPFCNNNLSVKDNSLICSKNHTFNINKKGYLYLNVISNLHSQDLYNDSLFKARREVINSGIYNKIHSEIIGIIKK